MMGFLQLFKARTYIFSTSNLSEDNSCDYSRLAHIIWGTVMLFRHTLDLVRPTLASNIRRWNFRSLREEEYFAILWLFPGITWFTTKCNWDEIRACVFLVVCSVFVFSARQTVRLQLCIMNSWCGRSNFWSDRERIFFASSLPEHLFGLFFAWW